MGDRDSLVAGLNAGLNLSVSQMVDLARGVAVRELLAQGVALTEGAVCGLAAVMLVSAAEEVAGGNPDRPAFKTYSESLLTVAENIGSDFVKGRRRG